MYLILLRDGRLYVEMVCATTALVQDRGHHSEGQEDADTATQNTSICDSRSLFKSSKVEKSMSSLMGQASALHTLHPTVQAKVGPVTGDV